MERRSETAESMELRLLNEHFEENGVKHAERRVEQAEKAAKTIKESPNMYKSTALFLPYAKCLAEEEHDKRVSHFSIWCEEMLNADRRQEEMMLNVQNNVVNPIEFSDEQIYIAFSYLDELTPENQLKTEDSTYELQYRTHELKHTPDGKYD